MPGGLLDDAGVGLAEGVLEFAHQVVLFALQVEKPFEMIERKGLDRFHGQGAGLLPGLVPGLLGVLCAPLELVVAGCVLVRWIDGSDGTLGLEPGWASLGSLDRDLTFLPAGSPPEPRARSFIAPLIFSGSASFFWFDRNAKYESGMSSKSITRSHSSQRQVGGSCGGGPMSPASTRSTFSSSHSGQK